MAAETPGTVRRRGRPKGSKNRSTVAATSASTKRRGRPPGSKNKSTEARPAVAAAPARRRGRPPGSKNKSATSVVASTASTPTVSSAPRRRGRPPGSTKKVSAPSVSAAPKRRGRPPGSSKTVSAPSASAAPKRRGRPPGSGKKLAPAPVAAPLQAMAGVLEAIAPVKRRGRPAGSKNKASGKRRGRPRKSVVSTPVVAAQSASTGTSVSAPKRSTANAGILRATVRSAAVAQNVQTGAIVTLAAGSHVYVDSRLVYAMDGQFYVTPGSLMFVSAAPEAAHLGLHVSGTRGVLSVEFGNEDSSQTLHHAAIASYTR